MSTADIPVRGGNPACQIPSVDWATYTHECVFQCEAIFCSEDEGFSVHCLNLPGVISQGDSEQQAIENIKDAFRETILYHKETGTPIPWVEDTATERAEFPTDAKIKWLLVRV